MHKTVTIIFLALMASIIAVWYKATHTPTANTLDTNTLIVGVNAEYAPFTFMKDGIITGFDIDLMNEIARRMGKTMQLQDMPFDALIPALQLGTIHLIAGGITPTPERAQRALFTSPYLTGDPLIIVSLAAHPITTIIELDNKPVAVNEGYTADYYMSKIEGPELIRFASPLESFMALESGRVQAFVAAQSAIKPFLDQYGAQKFSLAPIAGTSESSALAISKRYPELLEPIQKALDEMSADGTLETLKKKWGLFSYF